MFLLFSANFKFYCAKAYLVDKLFQKFEIYRESGIRLADDLAGQTLTCFICKILENSEMPTEKSSIKLMYPDHVRLVVYEEDDDEEFDADAAEETDEEDIVGDDDDMDEDGEENEAEEKEVYSLNVLNMVKWGLK